MCVSGWSNDVKNKSLPKKLQLINHRRRLHHLFGYQTFGSCSTGLVTLEVKGWKLLGGWISMDSPVAHSLKLTARSLLRKMVS